MIVFNFRFRFRFRSVKPQRSDASTIHSQTASSAPPGGGRCVDLARSCRRRRVRETPSPLVSVPSLRSSVKGSLWRETQTATFLTFHVVTSGVPLLHFRSCTSGAFRGHVISRSTCRDSSSIFTRVLPPHMHLCTHLGAGYALFSTGYAALERNMCVQLVVAAGS